jgi:outer membrane lipoprotein-sorting protein
VTYSNDAVDIWTGTKAYAGWTESNADARARYNQPDHIAGRATYSVTASAGSYVPLRFVFGQAQYGGGFSFTVTAPNGQVIVSDQSTASPYVVRYSCDQVTAPLYPPFGREP